MTVKLITFLVFLCIYGALAVNQAIVTFTPTVVAATGVSLSDQISGYAFIEQFPGGTTNITINVSGITTNPNSMHAIQIHQYGDLRGVITFDTPGSGRVGGNSAGDDYNPANATHGCETNATHYVGDLGNWQATNGVISQTKTFNYILIDGTSTSVIGRTMVIHADQDDCVNENSAGSRIAYGVIGIKNVTNNTAHASSGNTLAVCVLQGTANCMGSDCMISSAGEVTFSQVNGGITVYARVNNITIPRGFHVHTFGDMNSTDGTSAGSHWNPDGYSHALPDATYRHAGDLGNVQSFSSGNVGYYAYTAMYSPSNQLTIDNILGRSIVIHLGVDHGNDTSCPGALENGDSGLREYICVIGIYNSNSTSIPSDVGYLTQPNSTLSAVQINNVWQNVPCGAVTNNNSTNGNGTNGNGGAGGIITGNSGSPSANNNSPNPAPDGNNNNNNGTAPLAINILGQNGSSRVVFGGLIMLFVSFMLL